MSLRFQFLIAVNLTLICVLALFLYLDFRFQSSTHLAELTVDTRREAELLAQTVANLSPDDRVAMQSMVDHTAEVLRSEGSTRRDLAVVAAGNDIIFPSGSRDSVSQIESLIRRVDDATLSATDDWVFSFARVGERWVYLFRNAAEARAISAEHALWRLAEIALLGMLATGLINLLMIRLVIRPFTDLARTIRLIGNGEFGAITGTFHSREFQSLATDLNQMSLALARAERERGLQMSKAGRLQHRLQSSGVTVPGLKVVHWHEAADHVAGDYFDLLRCPDGFWLICIADVTGHGVAAAMGAAILKTLLWSAVESGGDLDQIVRSVNQRFSEVTLEEDFASLLLIRWSPESSELQYANAGHETAYLLHKGSTPQFLGSTGTLVGIARDHIWEIKNMTIMPGSRLVLCTDGITEARSPAGKHFGRERLKRMIHEQSGYTVQDTIDCLVDALRSHLDGSPADDDLTLVGLEFAGKPESETPQLGSVTQDEG